MQRVLIIASTMLLLLHLTSSAMVLPRPPSSPNHIQTEEDPADRKFYEGKSLQGLLHNTNVERPDTEDYRLLEIELQSADDMDAANLQNLVHAMLKQAELRNASYPNPEVIPHSILGVRDVGLPPNFRGDVFDEKRAAASAKFRALGEKLYYLKTGKPKVYVNVRGRSGAFRKDGGSPGETTPSNGPVGYLRVTQPFQRQTDWKSSREKKPRPPKKYGRRVDGERVTVSREDARAEEGNRVHGQAAAYSLEDLSTTENSMVTSSELPKQIPAPPSKLPGRSLMAQTTPVQRYALRRTDVLPGYRVTEDSAE